jgi:hypothetical protein
VNRFFFAALSFGALILCACGASAAPVTQPGPVNALAQESPTAANVEVSAPCAEDAEAQRTTGRRALAVAAAVVPGILVHGAGHWVNGQPCTAKRLIKSEAVSLTALAVGIPTLALTGGSRYLATPAILLTMGGFGIIFAAIGADIYGVTGAARYAGEPTLVRPRWETELGVMRVYNPHFDFNWLVTQSLASNVGRARFSAALDTALDGPHARYRLGSKVRIVGALPNAAALDGSYFDLGALVGEQRFLGMGFVTDSIDFVAAGRVDLGRFAPTFRGSFADFSAGVQFSRTSYRIFGMSVDSDSETMLLGRIGFGAYLGRGKRSGGEAMAYYDHRRDDYAAGIKLPGYGNGMVGHVGLSGRYFLTSQLGVGVLLETGSSHVAGLSLLFRAGAKQ